MSEPVAVNILLGSSSQTPSINSGMLKWAHVRAQQENVWWIHHQWGDDVSNTWRKTKLKKDVLIPQGEKEKPNKYEDTNKELNLERHWYCCMCCQQKHVISAVEFILNVLSPAATPLTWMLQGLFCCCERVWPISGGHVCKWLQKTRLKCVSVTRFQCSSHLIYCTAWFMICLLVTDCASFPSNTTQVYSHTHAPLHIIQHP